MALTLDPRQRAMLQEMGITLWWPPAAAPVQRSAAPPVVAPAAAAPSADVSIAAPTPVIPVPAASQPASVVAAPAPLAPPTVVTSVSATSALPSWHIAPAVTAYPHATGGSADDAWLVLWECATPATPLEGDSGKLLHQILRALRLHHSAHVWIAGLQRAGSEALPSVGVATAPVDWQALDVGIRAAVGTAQPARVVVLGLHAARAVLSSQEALGRLRAQVHQLHDRPVVVSYDPAYLLRSPHAKPAAWADWCRAHALRPPSVA